MYLKQLKINGFRCYDSVELNFDQRINVLCGDNGAGKTSVLEAIYYLSTGKSFRSKRTKNLINHNNDELTLFSCFESSDGIKGRVGVSLNKNLKKQIKLNQRKVNNQSDIAHLLPVVSIDPDSYLFLDKPPQFRRSFLDWLVFHVKPQYLKTWSRVSRCQKQLNSLYKNKSIGQLQDWENQYIKYAIQLTEMRLQTFTDLELLVKEKINKFVPELNELNLTFYQGWSSETPLQDQLKKDREKNLIYGNLTHGPHKMDIKNKINQGLAHERLSRGQKKLISIIYYLSFIELLSSELNTNPILCLDDMDAELDLNKAQVLCDFIQHSPNQIFISTVDPDKLLSILDDVHMFHVKHNQIDSK